MFFGFILCFYTLVCHQGVCQELSLDISYARKNPTNRWVDKIDDLLKGKTILNIDLREFYSDNLKNINIFLLEVSKRNEILLEELNLLNATSQKFNVLSLGIKNLFKKESFKTISYKHSSKPNPRSATNVLKLLASEYKGATFRAEVREEVSIFLSLTKNTVKSNEEESFSNIDSLETNIFDEEFLLEEAYLKEDFDDLKSVSTSLTVKPGNDTAFDPNAASSETKQVESEAPVRKVDFSPFGFSFPHQVIERNMDNFPSLRVEHDLPCFLIIRGADSSDIDQISSFCINHNIFCLSLIDSLCAVESLIPLFECMKDKKLKYVDVRKALEYSLSLERMKSLKYFFETHGLKEWENRLIWCEQEEKECIEGKECLEAHKTFWFIEKWVEHIKRKSVKKI